MIAIPTANETPNSIYKYIFKFCIFLKHIPTNITTKMLSQNTNPNIFNLYKY